MSLLPRGSREFDEVLHTDVLVVGAGAAGLTAALGCAPMPVTVLNKARLGSGGSSLWAQGGVAAALGQDDAPALHSADTIAAGAGLNDPAVVDLLTGEGPERVQALLELGARFDRNSSGELALGREAAHSRRRILHAHGDATGAEIVRALVEAVRRAPEIRVVDETFAVDLVQDGGKGGRVVGLTAVDRSGRRKLFLNSTNPVEATGDGLAMAARAGARLVDLEFVQFHPTALAASAGTGLESSAPLPLLTEALRGEGAVLIDGWGRRFMLDEHPDAELAPRDVVSRAIWRRLMNGGRVFLDARAAVGERFPDRFPTVFQLCREAGLDPRVEPIPVAPAAHYHMGGIAVDEHGRSSLAGLWACGEVSATGAHGANRLASNSLLEALVFGARVAEDLRSSSLPAAPPAVRPASARQPMLWAPGDGELTLAVRKRMWEQVGLVRDEAGLRSAAAELERLAARHPRAAGEARNLLALGRLVTSAALARRESRGGHFRTDFPEADPLWQRRLFLTAATDGSARFEARLPGEGTIEREEPALALASAGGRP